jgi:ABC-type lipoprotein export system ATPase subunit
VSDSSSVVLRAEGVAKSFPFENKRIHVLEDINLSLESGKSLSIRGDSGCGKTTLLNLLSRLESADCGTVKWQDFEMNASKQCASKEGVLRAHFLGVVYQAYYLIPELNVLENVLIAAKLAGAYGNEVSDRARELLSNMGMGNKERQIPGKLSGGERQRVAIARAMINSPKLILADEPTGNLDERTGGEVMELLLESCDEEKTALVLVTHNQKFADTTDETLFLKEGKFQN